MSAVTQREDNAVPDPIITAGMWISHVDGPYRRARALTSREYMSVPRAGTNRCGLDDDSCVEL
jgi:hypothetical protein